MRLLDVCSGIGGFSLGLEWAGFETVAFCEWDEACRKVLDKHWPEVPKYTDLRELTKKRLDDDGIRDIRSICGGYPCQPFSLAGKREGEADDRHLWPDIARLLREFIDAGEPIEWCIFENVYGHLSMGLDDVLVELEHLDYSWWAFVVPALSVGACHERKRVWIVAHANSLGSERLQRKLGESGTIRQGGALDAEAREHHVTHTHIQRQSGSGRAERRECSEAAQDREEYRTFHALRWPTEPAVRGRNDGVSARLDKDRLKQLGNSVVPQLVKVIGDSIMATER